MHVHRVPWYSSTRVREGFCKDRHKRPFPGIITGQSGRPTRYVSLLPGILARGVRIDKPPYWCVPSEYRQFSSAALGVFLPVRGRIASRHEPNNQQVEKYCNNKSFTSCNICLSAFAGRPECVFSPYSKSVASSRGFFAWDDDACLLPPPKSTYHHSCSPPRHARGFRCRRCLLL